MHLFQQLLPFVLEARYFQWYIISIVRDGLPTYNFHSAIFHPILPSVDSTLTVNIFLLCGNFPISPPFYQFAAFLPWGIGGIRNIGSRTHSVHLALLSCHRKGFLVIHLRDLDWYVCYWMCALIGLNWGLISLFREIIDVLLVFDFFVVIFSEFGIWK